MAGATVAPALFMGALPGLEVVQPMAVVMLGGLVTCTVLDLFMFPAMFLALGVSSAREPDPFLESGTDRGFDMDAEPSGAAGQ